MLSLVLTSFKVRVSNSYIMGARDVSGLKHKNCRRLC